MSSKTDSNIQGLCYNYLPDLPQFDLCDADKRVPEYLIPLTPAQEQSLQCLLDEEIFIAAHEHTEILPRDLKRDLAAYQKAGRRCMGYEALTRSYYNIVFDSISGGIGKGGTNPDWKWEEAIHDFGMRLCDIKQHKGFKICQSVEDILEAKRTHQLGWVAGMESCACIENDLDRLDVLYGFGLRTIGITFSCSNSLGCGGQDRADYGLTNLGVRAVERMNQLGLLIDCAHASTQTILDTVSCSSKPILLSHIGARTLRDNPRMATDEALLAVAKSGGLIGIEAAPHSTISCYRKEHDVYAVMDHFEYIRNLVGIDHVTFGPDTLYGDHRVAQSVVMGGAGDKPGAYVRGMENPTECSKNILRYLIAKQYSHHDIQKVIGGNMLRVLRQVW